MSEIKAVSFDASEVSVLFEAIYVFVTELEDQEMNAHEGMSKQEANSLKNYITQNILSKIKYLMDFDNPTNMFWKIEPYYSKTEQEGPFLVMTKGDSI